MEYDGRILKDNSGFHFLTRNAAIYLNTMTKKVLRAVLLLNCVTVSYQRLPDSFFERFYEETTEWEWDQGLDCDTRHIKG